MPDLCVCLESKKVDIYRSVYKDREKKIDKKASGFLSEIQ